MTFDTILSFLKENGVAVFFGITTVILTYIALRYRILTYRATVQKNVELSGVFSVYLNRDSILMGLLGMYNRAGNGDELWGQCVSCHNYSDDIHKQVLDKAIAGVSYRMLLNKSRKDALEKLFGQIQSAKTAVAEDVKIRIHGLNNREVIIGISTISGTKAIHFKDKDTTEILLDYFNVRWDKYYNEQNNYAGNK